MAKGVNVDPERLRELSTYLYGFAERASELTSALERTVFDCVEQLRQQYAHEQHDSAKYDSTEAKERLEQFRSAVAHVGELHQMLWTLTSDFRRYIDSSVPVARSHLDQMATDVEAFQSTAYPPGVESATKNPPSPSVADSENDSSRANPEVQLVCPVHQIPLLKCHKCGGKGYVLPVFSYLSPEKLFRNTDARGTKEGHGCAHCGKVGKYCPECKKEQRGVISDEPAERTD